MTTTSPREAEAIAHDLAVYAARLSRAIRRQTTYAAGVRVLSILDELGPSTVSVLAEADRCSQPTMSGLVARLVDDDLLARAPFPGDARASLLTLTAAGRAALADVRRRNAELLSGRARAGGLTAEELATAVKVLRTLLASEPSPATTKAESPL